MDKNLLPADGFVKRLYACFRTEQDEAREENPREFALAQMTEGCHSATMYCEGYKTSMASPKEKKRYPSPTATL